MAYTKGQWGRYTPNPELTDAENIAEAKKVNAVITLEKINNIENGIANAHKDISDIELTPGPQGKQGVKGDPGAKGSDGFGTKAQYDDIIERLNALESAE